MKPAPIDSDDRIKQVEQYLSKERQSYTKLLLEEAIAEIKRLRKLVKP